MDILKTIRTNLILFIMIFLLIVWGTTGSPNPLGFFEIESLPIKIVLIIIMVALFSHGLLNARLSRIPEDADCQDPECGRGIRSFFFIVYQGAIKCPQCGRWYHKLCWQRYNKTHTLWEIAKGCKRCKEEQENRESWLTPGDIWNQFRQNSSNFED